MKLRVLLCLALHVLLGGVVPQASSQEPAQASSQEPAPASILRYEKGYRYPQAGWIVLHIEGNSYERGFQHGRLLAPEIAGYLRCFARTLNDKAPNETWQHIRTLVNTVFLRKFDKEYLEEMKGIADGATKAGARIDGQAIDLVDIAAINCWCEIESLPAANAATPTELEGARKMDVVSVRPMPGFERCSAFAATGPATADGKIVFGHTTMYDLYAANFANVWIDVKPAQGHRFVMSSFPGGIQSSMDYYINDAGILISETSITQTRFNIDGMTCASRIRKAVQYADTINKAVEFLVSDSNGLYSNEWLLADINTNEIATLELGTRNYKLWRSSKGEWFGNTPGFYWSCNSMKDMDVCVETIASARAKPSKVVWRPSERDLAWQKLYVKHKGKIGPLFVKEFSESNILAGPTALDAKFTTTELARDLRTWAVFGPPTGITRNPTTEEKKKYPEIKPLVKNAWTLLGPTTPPKHFATLTSLVSAKPMPEPEIIWRGTLLPQYDGDLWLALAFADFHEIIAAEKMRLAKREPSKLQEALQECRRQYAAASRTGEVALANIKKSTDSDDWYRLASAKGVLLLYALRV